MPKLVRHDIWHDNPMLTSVSMTSVWRSGVLGGVPLGEGVESNGVRTRGIPPPPLKECFILKHDF